MGDLTNGNDLKKSTLALWDRFMSHLDKLLLEVTATKELDLTNARVLSEIEQGLNGVYLLLEQQLKGEQRWHIVVEEHTLVLEVFSLFDNKKIDYERLSEIAKDLRHLYRGRRLIKF